LNLGSIANGVSQALNGWMSGADSSRDFAVRLVAIPRSGDTSGRRELNAVYSKSGWHNFDELAEFLNLNYDSHDIYLAPGEIYAVDCDLTDDKRIPCVVHVSVHAELPDIPVKPWWVYEYALGRFVRLWLVSDLYEQGHKELMEALAIHYRCLPEFAKSSALVPLPGSYNHVDEFQHRCFRWDEYKPVSSREFLDAFVAPHKKKSASVSIESASSFLAQPKQREWLVQDYLGDGSLTIIQGQPEACKSFLAMGISACVATGTPWQDQLVKQGPVMYLAGERAGGMSLRFAAWSLHHNVSLNDVPLSRCITAPNFCDANEVACFATGLFRQVQEWGEPPKLVVIDTYTRHLGTEDENQASTVAKFMGNIDRYIRQPYGAAVLLVHHQGHSSQGRARGSSKLRTDIDAEYSARKIGRRVTLTCKKMNEAEYAEPLHLWLTTVELSETNADGSPITSAVLTRATAAPPESAHKSKAAPRLGRHQRSALKVLKGLYETLEDGQLIATADWLDECREVGIDRRRLPDARRGLIDRGLVREDGDYIILV
jgi:hypothetical protein